MTCALCGKPKNRSNAGAALYCLPCSFRSKPRIAAADRKRAGELTPARVGGSFVCLDCRAPIDRPVSSLGKMRPPLRCGPCGAARHKAMLARRQPAISAVAKAVAKGLLPRASQFACLDCGKPASQYDHRDYTKPLDVQPVCRSCNVIRGPALFPPLADTRPSRIDATH